LYVHTLDLCTFVWMWFCSPTTCPFWHDRKRRYLCIELGRSKAQPVEGCFIYFTDIEFERVTAVGVIGSLI
jgi:hypothetical protein